MNILEKIKSKIFNKKNKDYVEQNDFKITMDDITELYLKNYFKYNNLAKLCNFTYDDFISIFKYMKKNYNLNINDYLRQQILDNGYEYTSERCNMVICSDGIFDKINNKESSIYNNGVLFINNEIKIHYVNNHGVLWINDFIYDNPVIINFGLLYIKSVTKFISIANNNNLKINGICEFKNLKNDGYLIIDNNVSIDVDIYIKKNSNIHIFDNMKITKKLMEKYNCPYNYDNDNDNINKHYILKGYYDIYDEKSLKSAIQTSNMLISI